MKKNLYFQHSDGHYTLLLEGCCELEAWARAEEFMKDHNYKCYYVRSWLDQKGNLQWDVGSHTEFFVFGFIDMNS